MNRLIAKKTAAIVFAAAVAASVYFFPFEALPADGKKCLALSLAAVICWATGALHPGYTSLLLLSGYVLALGDAAPSPVIFGIWTSPSMYLVIGGFLITHAVQDSGLAKRVSLHFVRRFVRSYRSVIVSCYILGFLLSFMIPHPWPRSLLLMSVMLNVVKEMNLTKHYAGNIGLAVFAGSIPTSMILMTGDSTLNSIVGSMAGVHMSFMQWLIYMGLPGVVASVLTCLTQLLIFGKPERFRIDLEQIDAEIAQCGPIHGKEKWVIGILGIAVVMWMTDAYTGIHPGWIALLAAAAFALPFVGVLGAESWRHVNMGTLLFLCAALAIGAVGNVTGMNAWLGSVLLPSGGFHGLVPFTLIAFVFCVLLHLCLGSTLAVIGIAGPAIIAYGSTMGISPLISSMLVYSAVCLHWLLPFHHMNLLVGVGDGGGGFDNIQVMKFGAFQTLVVAAVCAVAVFWWTLLGLIDF